MSRFRSPAAEVNKVSLIDLEFDVDRVGHLDRGYCSRRGTDHGSYVIVQAADPAIKGCSYFSVLEVTSCLLNGRLGSLKAAFSCAEAVFELVQVCSRQEAFLRHFFPSFQISARRIHFGAGRSQFSISLLEISACASVLKPDQELALADFRALGKKNFPDFRFYARRDIRFGGSGRSGNKLPGRPDFTGLKYHHGNGNGIDLLWLLRLRTRCHWALTIPAPH